MTPLSKYLIIFSGWIFALIVLFWQGCGKGGNSGNSDTVRVKEYITGKTVHDTITRIVDHWHPAAVNAVASNDTSNYCDSIRSYTSFEADSTGESTVRVTAQGIVIHIGVERKSINSFRVDTIKETITINNTLPPRNKLFIGLQAGYIKEPVLSPSLMFITKRDRCFMVSKNVMNGWGEGWMVGCGVKIGK